MLFEHTYPSLAVSFVLFCLFSFSFSVGVLVSWFTCVCSGCCFSHVSNMTEGSPMHPNLVTALRIPFPPDSPPATPPPPPVADRLQRTPPPPSSLHEIRRRGGRHPGAGAGLLARTRHLRCPGHRRHQLRRKRRHRH